ncbi:hypothetical protein HZS_5703 [Henneguya salminicola]|nr:hypothetical protein HZS_5703 [Henneguya salminicola]
MTNKSYGFHYFGPTIVPIPKQSKFGGKVENKFSNEIIDFSKWHVNTLDEFVYYRNSGSNGIEYYKCANFKIQSKTNHQMGGTQPNRDSHVYDVENEINEYLVKDSKDLSKYPNQALIRFLDEKYKPIAIKIPSRNQVYNLIGYLRGPSTEALLTIEIQPHNSTIAERFFLQRSWVGKIYGQFQRFLMWSSDEGLAILRRGSELFIDATFCGGLNIHLSSV